MAYCLPATQFCCGCSIQFGVKSVILFNLLRALVALWEATMVIGLQHPDYDYLKEGRVEILVQSGMALAGVPVMLFALWGVSERDEGPIRVYGYYMLLGWLFDETMTVRSIASDSPCDFTAGHERSGQAFNCGAIRSLDFAAVATLTGIEFYFVFVIFSFCESLRISGGGAGFQDLSKTAFETNEAKVLESYLGVGQITNTSLEGSGCVGPQFISGEEASVRIFGKRHDMQFPPQKFFS